MKVGVVGYGVVGKHLAQLFLDGHREVVIYDKFDPEMGSESRQRDINSCDLVFISVPTPASEDGSCDISAVREVVAWILPPMCIKSTIPPGTVQALTDEFGKQIVFSPEYIGETPFHKSQVTRVPDLVAVGGERCVCERFISAYRDVLGPEPHYFVTDAITAELSKYMENCFFATKVAFVAQFYLLASHFGADFTQMREIWTADTRVGRSHSTVTGKLGFGGKCLPKDLSAIIARTLESGGQIEFLQAVSEFNTALRREEA